MNRKEMIAYLKAKVPSLRIEKSDAFGTRHSPDYLHCVVNKENVSILEKATEEIGKKAVWSICADTYGHHRVIALF